MHWYAGIDPDSNLSNTNPWNSFRISSETNATLKVQVTGTSSDRRGRLPVERGFHRTKSMQEN
ncbi:MAG: hypothetical protein CME31_15640 [Gimesia sp.]|uniref:Uncharacterized protein n=1 Tax=Gimesia maris TaxID=122 RepID=A0A3D3QZR9_9PLAN|nr:hypothetical protein [Gimesia sp.]HCO21989.1 hypothetical protein [Gimesia maris]